jgi:hypothetical protein
MNKLIVSLFTAVVALALSASLQADTVTWGAQISNGVGTANGTPLPNGSNDLILIGGFDISNATITANGSNEAFLLSHFTTFGSAAIGDGSPNGPGSASDGYWTAVTTNSANTLSLQNKEIFYWVFNAATPANATQYGIFTAPSNTSWVFPDDNSNPNTAITDLSQVPHDLTGILFGSFGTGLSRDGASSLYNLSAIPEPSTVAYLLFGGAGTLAIGKMRRRFKN